MSERLQRLDEAAQLLRSRTPLQPAMGIILGSGLGAFADSLEGAVSVPYAEIPHFPASTVVGHGGALVIGRCQGVPVAVMKGRVHFYEGYSLEQVVFPARVLGRLGIETLLVTNAAGAVNTTFAPGDLMVIEDHINLLGDNPLIGPNDDRLGDRFPDMCFPYDRELLKLGRRIALEEKIVCHQGVFVAVAGPNLETRAEYRFLRNIGADGVGMSTVPEVIVGVHAKMRILGISVITDICLPDALEPVSLPEIIATANEAEKKMRVLVKRVVAEL